MNYLSELALIFSPPQSQVGRITGMSHRLLAHPILRILQILCVMAWR
jgi:hypothetical protein